MKNLLIGAMLMISLTSCFEEKFLGDDLEQSGVVEFDFDVSSDHQLDLSFRDTSGQPLARIGIEMLTNLPENNGKILFQAFTDANGEIISTLGLPDNLDVLVLKINYSGTPKYFQVALENGRYQLYYKGEL